MVLVLVVLVGGCVLICEYCGYLVDWVLMDLV